MKTIHRIASRAKHAPLPKFWRQNITPDRITSAKIIHWDLIDRFTSGTADVQDFWDFAETGLTYSQMMQMLAESGTEFTPEAQQALADQLLTYEGIYARFQRTGRVGFSGTELLTAKAAANVMDALIEMDRFGIAERAGRWAVDAVLKLRAQSAPH
jgi:hypothetical protein